MSSSIELTSESTDAGPEPADAGPVDMAVSDAGTMDIGVDTGVLVECEEATDCVLVSECCPGCGPQHHDVLSIPYETSAAVPNPDICFDRDCDSCDGDPPDPLLIPNCVDGYCTFIDLDEPGELNNCTVGADEPCLLRASDCCDCELDPSYDTLVSINARREDDYLTHVCGEVSCRECLGIDYYEAGFESYCEALSGGGGQCVVLGPED